MVAQGTDPRDIAQAYLAAGQPEVALSHAGRYLATNPDDPGALYILSVALSKLGRPQEAADAAQRVAAMAPDSPQAWLALSQPLAEIGNVPGAVDAAARAFQLDPDDWMAHTNFAMIANQYAEDAFTGDGLARLRADALTHAQIGRKLAPDNPASWIGVSYCLADVGRKDEARAAVDEALRLAPDNLDAQTALGYLNAKTGKFADSVAANAGVLRDDPTAAIAEQNLAVSIAIAQARLIMMGGLASWLLFPALAVATPGSTTIRVLLAIAAVLVLGRLTFVVRQFAKIWQPTRRFIRHHRIYGVSSICMLGIVLALVVAAVVPHQAALYVLGLVSLPLSIAGFICWTIINGRLKQRRDQIRSGGGQ